MQDNHCHCGEEIRKRVAQAHRELLDAENAMDHPGDRTDLRNENYEKAKTVRDAADYEYRTHLYGCESCKAFESVKS
jgi:hypothetical protein